MIFIFLNRNFHSPHVQVPKLSFEIGPIYFHIKIRFIKKRRTYYYYRYPEIFGKLKKISTRDHRPVFCLQTELLVQIAFQF